MSFSENNVILSALSYTGSFELESKKIPMMIIKGERQNCPLVNSTWQLLPHRQTYICMSRAALSQPTSTAKFL